MRNVLGVRGSIHVLQEHSLLRLCGHTWYTGISGDGGCESDSQCCDCDAVIGDRKQVQTEF